MAPISFAIAGPLGRIFGPRPVLVAFGVFAGTAVAALAIVPGARSPERSRRKVRPRTGDLAQASVGGTGGAS
jgi:hypothetical protein